MTIDISGFLLWGFVVAISGLTVRDLLLINRQKEKLKKMRYFLNIQNIYKLKSNKNNKDISDEESFLRSIINIPLKSAADLKTFYDLYINRYNIDINPEIPILVGILGTFTGLIIAFWHGAGASHGMAALKEVFKPARLAFLTSIWGIVCAIIIDYFLGRYRAFMDDIQHNKYKNFLLELNKNKYTKRDSKEELNKAIEGFGQLNEQMGNFVAHLEPLWDIIKEMKVNSEVFRESIERMKEATESSYKSFDQGIDRIADEIGSNNKEFRAYIDDNSETMDRVSNTLQSQNENIQELFSSLDKRLQSSFDKINNSYEGISSIIKESSQSNEETSKSIENNIEKLNKLFNDKLSPGIQNIDKSINNMNTTINRMNHSIDNMAGEFKGIPENIKTFTEQANSIVEHIRNVTKTLDNSMKSVVDIFELLDKINAITQGLSVQRTVMKESANEALYVLKEFQKKINWSATINEDFVAEIVNDSKMTKAVDAFKQDLKTDMNNIAQSLNKLARSIDKSYKDINSPKRTFIRRLWDKLTRILFKEF